MKQLLTIALLAAATPALADQYVNGYTRQDGTYVAPHYRSNADGQAWNNYSTQGNVNPYNGQRGSVNPDRQFGSSGYYIQHRQNDRRF